MSGKDDAALKALQEALELERSGRRFYLEAAERTADPKGARMFRSREEAYATLANVYAEHDLNQDAIKFFGRAIKLNPKKVEYRRSLAMALQKQRQYDKAVAAWQRWWGTQRIGGRRLVSQPASRRPSTRRSVMDFG